VRAGEIISLLGGVLLGGLISWAITHIYYRRTVRDLRDLRVSIDRLPAGIVDAVRNSAGQIASVKALPNPPTDVRLS
jgi:hypothetical protein